MANRRYGWHSGALKCCSVDIGSSGSAIILPTYSDRAIDVYTTCSSADGSNSVQPIHMKSTMTGAGGVGGRACFHLYTNVALGGWCNAIKGYTEFGDSGTVTGLASSVLAEMKMPNAALGGGNFCCFEAELTMQASTTVGAGTSFMRAKINGTVADFLDNGFIFDFQGLGDATTQHIFQANNNSASHALRIRVGAATYYMLLSDTSD